MLKKIALFLMIFTITLSVVACAFTFPEPDWGALYREKEAMVTEVDFELYTEGTADDTVYYGAKLEPKSGVYLGTVPENSPELLPVSSYLTNIDAMSQDDLYYPANIRISEDNVISMIGWTIYDMNTVDLNQVRKVLDNLSKYNKPMLIRFANEMNCSNLGDEPDLYIEIFKKVADMVHEYPNFAVVWSPNDLGALDRPFEYYYPGDEYVDWVGVSCYMIKYFMGNQNTAYKDSVYFMTGDYAWATNKIKPIMDFMAKNNIQKPVMLSECGVATNSIYGETYENWNNPRMRNLLYNLVMKYPQIKMINYFDVLRSEEKERFNISAYSYAKEIFLEAKNCGAFITEYGKNPKFTYKSASQNPVITTENNVLKLHTLAYVPNMPDITVNYRIDGNWYHSSDKIPYTCNVDMSSLSDGAHTVEISTLDMVKTYSFEKSGDTVRFGEIQKASADEIKVSVNGEFISFDQPPVMINDRTLVPLRAIFEKLGAKVIWNDSSQSVDAIRDETTVSLAIGGTDMHVNGEVKILDVPAQLIGGRTLVPIRAISEAFGCSVVWIEETQTVQIVY